MNQDKLLKYVSIFSFFLMICVAITSMGVQLPQENISYASEITTIPFPTPNDTKPASTQETVNKQKIEVEELTEVAQDLLLKDSSMEVVEELGNNYIAIKKPESMSDQHSIELNDIAVDRRIEVTIAGVENEAIGSDEIYRVYQDNLQSGAIITIEPTPTPIIETKEVIDELEVIVSPTVTPTIEPEPTDNVTNMAIEYGVQDNGEPQTVITLDLIKTYAYKVYEDEQYFYIALLNPKEVYDTIVVLDAGHGGTDSGTYSNGYEYLEKSMNLDMILKLAAYLEQHENIKIYMTRSTDRRLTLNQRVNLANDVNADLFLSIHCNANLSNKVHGSEVLYNDKQNSWNSFNSKQFAQICLEELVANIGLTNRGIVARSHDVHIIGESKVPVALVEVAFMSNKNDMNFLKEEENRQEAAEGIYHAILRALMVEGKQID